MHPVFLHGVHFFILTYPFRASLQLAAGSLPGLLTDSSFLLMDHKESADPLCYAITSIVSKLDSVKSPLHCKTTIANENKS